MFLFLLLPICHQRSIHKTMMSFEFSSWGPLCLPLIFGSTKSLEDFCYLCCCTDIGCLGVNSKFTSFSGRKVIIALGRGAAAPCGKETWKRLTMVASTCPKTAHINLSASLLRTQGINVMCMQRNQPEHKTGSLQSRLHLEWVVMCEE